MTRNNSKSYEQMLKERQESLARQVRDYFSEVNKTQKSMSQTEVLADLKKRLQEFKSNKTPYGSKVTKILQDLIKSKS